MMYADSRGRVFTPEEIEAIPVWELESMGIHVYEEEPDEMTI